MTRKTVVLMLTLAVAAGAAWATEETRWINVNVTEAETQTNVELHLPLGLVTSIIEGIEVDGFKAGKVDIDIDDVEIDWPQIFAAVQEAPDGDFVKVRTEDADVEVVKRSGMMHIHLTEKDGEHAVVDVRMPMSMVDAFAVDENNEIDIMPILESLRDLPDGELVKVTSDEANVRIWIE